MSFWEVVAAATVGGLLARALWAAGARYKAWGESGEDPRNAEAFLEAFQDKDIR